MPERIDGSQDMWRMFNGESFVTTSGKIVRGPQKLVKVTTFAPEENLIAVEIGNKRYEVQGQTFDQVVH